MLHQRRGVDEAQSAVAEAEPGGQLLLPFVVGVDGDVADALAGEGQVLGVGGDDNRVVVGGEYLGELHAVEDDPLVGFVAYEEYLGAVLGLLAVQQGGKGRDFPGGVDHARRVVGRVYDEGAGARGDGLFDGVEVELEAVVGVDHHRNAVVVVYVVEVLEEVGR